MHAYFVYIKRIYFWKTFHLFYSCFLLDSSTTYYEENVDIRAFMRDMYRISKPEYTIDRKLNAILLLSSGSFSPHNALNPYFLWTAFLVSWETIKAAGNFIYILNVQHALWSDKNIKIGFYFDCNKNAFGNNHTFKCVSI